MKKNDRKKEYERALLQELNYLGFSKEQIIEDESPDFIVDNGGERIGLELTDYVEQVLYQIEVERQKIVEDAVEKFEKLSSTPLDVLFSWNEICGEDQERARKNFISQKKETAKR